MLELRAKELTNQLHSHDYLKQKIASSIDKSRQQSRDSELIVKYNIELKTHLQQGISEPIYYGDLVYKFIRIVGKPNFSDHFKNIIKRYIKVGYNLDVMRQSVTVCMPGF